MRVYVAQPLTGGTLCTLEGAAARHIRLVLRLRVGDALVLFDGRGGEYDGRLDSFGREEARVAIGAHRAIERESPLAITLLQGISRGERMDLVVQKATELGVAGIVPVAAERSVVRLDERQAGRRLEHWRSIAAAACEQCGRNRLPAIERPQTLDEALQGRAPGGARLMLHAEGVAALSPEALRGSPAAALLIGPEGGLTEAERTLAERHGFTACRFGPRVLRTETAALAAVAVLQAAAGDLLGGEARP